MGHGRSKAAARAMAAPEITGLKGEKGLANNTGLHHCFVNVVIQSLWHLRSFRERFSRLQHHHLQSAGLLHGYVGVSPSSAAAGLNAQSSDGDDVQMITAAEHEEARQAGGRPPNPSAPPPPEEHPMDDRDACVCCALKLIFVHYEHSDASIIPPDTLRYALSLLLDNRGSSMFRLREQSDAEEALNSLLQFLHYDHIGPSGMAKLPQPAKGSLKAEESVLSRSLDAPCTPSCLSHKVFGSALMDQKTCAHCQSTSDPETSSSFLYRLYVDEHVAAKRAHPQWSMEQLLMHSYLQQNYSCPSSDLPGAPKCPGPAKLRRYVLDLPEVLALQCVWSSPETERKDIQAFMQTIPQQLQVDQFLAVGANKDSQTSNENKQLYTYKFRGMILYYGRHYMAVFYSSAFHSFVMFDDKRVSNLGTWESVLDRCARGKLQPTVLFFQSENPLVEVRLQADIARADAEDEARVARERAEAGLAAAARAASASPPAPSPASAPAHPSVAAAAAASSVPDLPSPEVRATGDAFFGTRATSGQKHIIPVPIISGSDGSATPIPVTSAADKPRAVARQPTAVFPSYFSSVSSPSQSSSSPGASLSDDDVEWQRFWEDEPPTAAAAAPGTPGIPSFGYASPSVHVRRPSLLARQTSGWICSRCTTHHPGFVAHGECPTCLARATRVAHNKSSEANAAARQQAFHQQHGGGGSSGSTKTGGTAQGSSFGPTARR